jgi:hypothetical protein
MEFGPAGEGTELADCMRAVTTECDDRTLDAARTTAAHMSTSGPSGRAYRYLSGCTRRTRGRLAAGRKSERCSALMGTVAANAKLVGLYCT